MFILAYFKSIFALRGLTFKIENARMSGMEKQHIEGDKISIRGARANNLKNIDIDML